MPTNAWKILGNFSLEVNRTESDFEISSKREGNSIFVFVVFFCVNSEFQNHFVIFQKKFIH